MQLKIIGNKSAFADNKDTENSVSLTGDITDEKILSALAIVGFAIGQVRGGHEPYDALQSAGVKEQCGIYITNDDLQQAKDDARREGYNAGFAAALPPGHVAYSDAELQQVIDNAFMRGKEMGAAAAEVPANFPIPSDVWYGKHYGEFVTIPGFAPDSIPGASEHGYELQRVYAHKSGAQPSVPANVVLETADPAQSHANMIEQGFIPAIVILMR